MNIEKELIGKKIPIKFTETGKFTGKYLIIKKAQLFMNVAGIVVYFKNGKHPHFLTIKEALESLKQGESK